MKHLSILFLALAALLAPTAATAQQTTPAAQTAKQAVAEPSIRFEKTVHNFGTFSEKDPVHKCDFVFTNVGSQPLLIHQAVASCGCTVPKYSKKAIAPGERGVISVTYNGKGKFPGHFKKTITVSTNGKPETVRLYVEGDMTEK